MITSRIVYCFALLVVIGARAIPQVPSPTEEERQQILTDITDSDPFVQSKALDEAIKYQMTEVLPLIQERLWVDSKYYTLLRALDLLHSTDLCTTARMLADSASAIAQLRPGVSYIELRVLATEYLFRCGDFSTASDVFQGLSDSTGNPMTKNYRLLKQIAENVPQYADSARAELQIAVIEGSTSIVRRNALEDLVDLFGQQEIQKVMEMAANDPDENGINRLVALEYLFSLDYSGLHSFLMERLNDEAVPAYRIRIADSLLTHFGTLQDYLFVHDHLEIEQSPMVKEIVAKDLLEFVPPAVPSTTPIVKMIDSLESYKHAVVAAGWLSDAVFANELDDGLQSARSSLASGDSVNCAFAIRSFQFKVDTEYRDSLDNDGRTVTIEGWKFLYYGAQYILDRLPQPCQSPGSSVSNFNGTLIAGGNCIWFNGVVKINNRGSAEAQVYITGGTITSANFTVSVPDNVIMFSQSEQSASVVFNASQNRWETTVPVNYSDNVFLAGVMFSVPAAGLPGGINPVTWNVSFSANMPGLSAQWKWAAAVYTQCEMNNNGLGVKPIDGSTLNPYNNSDHAGTPEAIKTYVVGGARGGGGSNYTGGYSGTSTVPICH